jgi:hypothetical protein
VNAAVEKYILPIFDSATSIAAISSSKDKANEMQGQLQAIGFDVEILNISNPDDEASESGSEEMTGASGDEESGSETGSSESWQIENGDTEMK